MEMVQPHAEEGSILDFVMIMMMIVIRIATKYVGLDLCVYHV